MKLFEYQGRELFARFGIPAPSGIVVELPEELEARRGELRFPAVVKAQVLSGGRGKAGGIRFANSVQEAQRHTQEILGMRIGGHVVRKVLVVEKLDFEQELYASVLIDRSSRSPLVMVSAEGGVEIESVPDDRIRKAEVNPLVGFQPYHARDLVQGLGLAPEIARQVQAVLAKLYQTFRACDAELVEVNPLAVTRDGRVVAADSKVILNDGALFRHPEFRQADEELTPLEQEAREAGIAFIQLEGRIGVVANGAGLTMATLDALSEYGGKPGVFLDLGGTDDPDQVTRAIRLMKKARPTVMLLNLFGGITKTDTVALGLKEVLDKEGVEFPIVARIKGTNEARAKEILKDAGLRTADTLEEAAKLAVAAERGHEGGR